MAQLSSEKPTLFKGRHFNHLLIIQAVRWHVTYKLSYRDVCDLMAERGVMVVLTTVLRWVQRLVPAFEKKWKKYARPVGSSWRVDETYIKVKGHPEKITLDGSQASHQAVVELKAEGVLPAQTLVRTSKYLNNLIEPDHRRVKQRYYPIVRAERLDPRLNLCKPSVSRFDASLDVKPAHRRLAQAGSTR